MTNNSTNIASDNMNNNKETSSNIPCTSPSSSPPLLSTPVSSDLSTPVSSLSPSSSYTPPLCSLSTSPSSHHTSNNLRYRCLILDHDDTAVESTRTVHYPAYLKAMECLRPLATPVSLEKWFEVSGRPNGVIKYYKEIMNFTDEEVAKEYNIWTNYAKSIMPDFYEGFLEAVSEYVLSGGMVVVVTLNDSAQVSNHYSHAISSSSSRLSHCIPRHIYGWDSPHGRKPSPDPLLHAIKRLNLSPKDVLVVDDNRPGIDMALAVGVDAAGVGYSHETPTIRNYLREKCTYFLNDVEEFRELILTTRG